MAENGINERGYTRDQQVQLDEAKRAHQETTASAQRALMVSGGVQEVVYVCDA